MFTTPAAAAYSRNGGAQRHEQYEAEVERSAHDTHAQHLQNAGHERLQDYQQAGNWTEQAKHPCNAEGAHTRHRRRQQNDRNGKRLPDGEEHTGKRIQSGDGP